MKQPLQSPRSNPRGPKAQGTPRARPERQLPSETDEMGLTTYTRVIFDLMRDPVSMGVIGGNMNGGRQR